MFVWNSLIAAAVLIWRLARITACGCGGRSAGAFGAALLVLAGAGAYAQSAAPNILAYYRFDEGTANNLVAPGNALTLRNTTYANGGLYMNGINGDLPGGFLAVTDALPGLDYNSFSVLVEFNTDKSGVAMPLLILGDAYRSLAIRIEANAQLNITLNIQAVRFSLPETAIKPNTWYRAALAFDRANGKLLFAMDGGAAQTFALPRGFAFAFDFMAPGVSEAARLADSNFTFREYAAPQAFSGYVRTLIVYGQALTAAALTQTTQALPPVPSASTIALASPGVKVLGDAPFVVSATSNVDRPITVLSLTTSTCTISGMTVTLVSKGTCTLVAGQAGFAGSATASFLVSETRYQPLVRTSSGRAAYLVVPSFDLRAPINVSPQIDRVGEIVGLVYASYGNYFDSIFLVNNIADQSVINDIGYAGYNIGIVSNESGLGRAAYDLAASYGAKSRLRSFMHIPWTAGGLTKGPSLHEFMHNWGNHGFISTVDKGHWGFASTGSQLGGFDRSTLTQTGANTWTAKGPAGRTRFATNANGGNGIPYGNAELYLMGLIPPSQLEPVLVATNASFTATGAGTTFTADGIETLTAADLISRAGARFPSSDYSQKRFDVLFILISNTTPTAAEISELDAQIEQFTRQGSDGHADLYNFWEATGGRAIMVPVDIATVSPAATPASGNDQLFDWAEHVFPTLLPAAGKTRGQTSIYDYACYATNVCLGLDAQRNVFFYDGKSIQPVGKASDYAGYMRAVGF